MENLPDYISWVFAAATLATVIFYLSAIWSAGRSSILLVLTAIILALLLLLHAILAYNSFYLVITNPSRFLLGPFPTIVTLLLLYFAFAKKDMSAQSLQLLTLLSIIRVPVEFVLLGLYQGGQVPQLMTFEGRNFDILSGLSAPLVAWLAFRGSEVNRRLLIMWNVLACGLLLNIMVNAMLSLEGPFQRFAFEQPNRGVLYFPFIWLPAIIVPIVFVSHVISLWHLLKQRTWTSRRI